MIKFDTIDTVLLQSYFILCISVDLWQCVGAHFCPEIESPLKHACMSSSIHLRYKHKSKNHISWHKNSACPIKWFRMHLSSWNLTLFSCFTIKRYKVWLAERIHFFHFRALILISSFVTLIIIKVFFTSHTNSINVTKEKDLPMSTPIEMPTMIENMIELIKHGLLLRWDILVSRN